MLLFPGAASQLAAAITVLEEQQLPCETMVWDKLPGLKQMGNRLQYCTEHVLLSWTKVGKCKFPRA